MNGHAEGALSPTSPSSTFRTGRIRYLLEANFYTSVKAADKVEGPSSRPPARDFRPAESSRNSTAASATAAHVVNQTVSARRGYDISISNWSIIGGFIFTAILIISSLLPFYQNGLKGTKYTSPMPAFPQLCDDDIASCAERARALRARRQRRLVAERHAHARAAAR
jgi:hypothetical protein